MSLAAPDAVPAETTLRRARPEDIDALVDIENAAFETDRLSRRSFRYFVGAPTASLIVAEAYGRVAGYALVHYRTGTALARLYSIAIADFARGLGLGRKLLQASEAAALARGCLYFRLEVREDNEAAIALYRSAGYRQFGRYLDYYEDHADALRFEKRLSPPGPEPSAVLPFYEQTTDFTCGPACMIMALMWGGVPIKPNPHLELQLWREATTIFMTSGHGGCEPFGLAVTMARRGLRPEIWVSRPGPYFLESVRSAEKRKVMALVQQDFRTEAERFRIPVRYEWPRLSRILEALDEGAIAIVLVSGFRMFLKKVPHWLVVHGHDGRHVFVHDPWVEDERFFETPAAAANLPIPFAEFQRMARYGRGALRAAVIVRKGRPT